MPVLLNRVVAWLREGYPTGVPAQDYIPLLALLRRRLTDDEVAAIAAELAEEGMLTDATTDTRTDIAVSITKITDEVPAEADVERVKDHLAFRGFPT